MSETNSSNKSNLQIHDISYYRANILQNIFTGLVIIGTILFFASSYSMFQRQEWGLIAIYSVVYAGILVITFVKKIPYQLKGFVLLFLFYLLAFTGFAESGLSGDGRIFLISFIILATVLFGLRAGIITGVVAILTLTYFGVGMSSGFVDVPPVEILANSGYGIDWLTGSITFTLIATIFISAIVLTLSGLTSSLENLKKTTIELENERNNLENTVADRTQALERKAKQLITATHLSEEIALQRNLQTLINSTVDLIRDRFNYYHASIFLVDEAREFAIVRASTGEAGRQLLERQHKLRYGEGLVGYAVKTGKSRIASDVFMDSVHYKNPLLPDTRSEAAIPLIYRDLVVGAIDVQSIEENAFQQDDLDTLQFIANGIAIAIANAYEITNLNEKLTEYERERTGFVTKSWEEYLKNKHKTISIGYKNNQISTLERVNPDFHKVKTQQTRIIKQASENDGKHSILAIPIIIRGEVLGVIDFQIDLPYVSENLLRLADAVASRLAVALENARLVEELEGRTLQEKMISEISNKVRTSTEIDMILKTTAEELGKTFGASEVLIQLDPSVQI